MQDRKLIGAVIFTLLLASIVSAFFLVFQQKTPTSAFPLKLKKIALSQKPAIGVVEVYGPVYAPQEESSIFSYPTLKTILEALKHFREDKQVKAVIIKINSPGGTVGAVQEITQEIKRLRDSGKPVIASVSDLAASGGYYIAAACDKIIVNSGSVIGSIGVVYMSSDMSRLLEKVGINVETIKSGPYKDVGSFHRPLSIDEKKFLQELIDDAYDQFVDVVSEGRQLGKEVVKKYAKGQLYTGRKSREIKLVDELGDFETARIESEKMAGIEDSRIIEFQRKGINKLFQLFSENGSLAGIFKKDKFSGLAYIYKP
jgi:protease-4